MMSTLGNGQTRAILASLMTCLTLAESQFPSDVLDSISGTLIDHCPIEIGLHHLRAIQAYVIVLCHQNPRRSRSLCLVPDPGAIIIVFQVCTKLSVSREEDATLTIVADE